MMRLRRHHLGFTIVELLVAAAITVIIVVLLGTMFGSLTGTASHANQQIDAFRDARAAMQMIERDFSNLIYTQWEPDPFATPAPTVAPQPRTKPVAYLALQNVYADPLAYNQQLYGLIALKNSSAGDVCSVGYYCAWNGRTYSLRRFFRDSAATYGTLSVATPAYLSETDVYKPNPTGSPADDVLAQYVWNLRVTPFDATGKALTYPYICDSSATAPVPRPAAIEISFLAMSPEAGRTAAAAISDPKVWGAGSDPAASGGDKQLYDRLIKPHAYEFRSRIRL